MCNTCMGNLQTPTLYACLQGPVNCKNGSFEVLNGKTYVGRENSSMGLAFVRI